MDYDFPKDPKEITERLLRGGHTVSEPEPEPEKLTPKEQEERNKQLAWERAIAAGVIYVSKPKVAPAPPPPKPPIFDSKPIFNLTKFTKEYEVHFDDAIEVYAKLLCKSLAYNSAIQILENHLNQLDQFRGVTAEMDLIKRIIRVDIIKGLCEKLGLDPEIFYPRTDEKPRKPPRNPSTNPPQTLSDSNLDAILHQIDEKLKAGAVREYVSVGVADDTPPKKRQKRRRPRF